MENINSSIDECIQNGKRLMEDAELLQDMDRYPTSYSISILAQEEFAKALNTTIFNMNILNGEFKNNNQKQKS